MWARPLGSMLYVLENIPFYAYELSCGDTVVGEPTEEGIVVRGLERRGGHSTYRLFLTEGVTIETFLERWATLQQMGCVFERATDRLFAIDVSARVDIYRVYDLLEHGERGRGVGF